MFSIFSSWRSADNDGLYKYSSKRFQLFLVYIEYVLFIYTAFVLSLWVWDYLTDYLPDHLFSLFYNVLWTGVGLDFIFRLFFAKNIIGYIRREWFTLFIVLFPILQPLRVFGISRYILLVFSKSLYRRFTFIRESRVLEILLISIVVSILSADLFLLFESNIPGTKFTKFSDALWFSVVTVATVGYGDVVPLSVPGRILATLLIFFGVSVFGLVTASISSYIITRRMKAKQTTLLNNLLGMSPIPFADPSSDTNLLSKLDQVNERLENIERLLQNKSKK